MQSVSSKLLETLKQKNIDLNLEQLQKVNASKRKTSENFFSKRDKSPVENKGNTSVMGATNSKFRVRKSAVPGNIDDTLLRQTFSKTMAGGLQKSTSGTKSDLKMKAMPSTGSLHKGVFLSTQSTWSGKSPRETVGRSESRISDGDGDNDNENNINFVNVDPDDDIDARIREELEIFNDIAGLNELKLAELIKVDVDSLAEVTKAEMRVDLSFNSLQYAGDILVNLRQLKLNGSIINSLRDIGNSFRNLEILWISKCGMKDLAGLSSFPKLKELYAPYNSIKDLSNIILHDNLQVLDLEGNELENLDTLENLLSVDNLNNLNLSSNPLCKIENYENRVFEMLPQLEYLNDQTKEEIQEPKLSPKNYDLESKDDLDDCNDAGIKELYDKFRKLKLFAVDEFEENSRQVIMKNIAKEPTEEELIMMSVKKTSKKVKACEQDPEDFGKFTMQTSSKKSLMRPQSSKARIGGAKPTSIFSDVDRIRNFGGEGSDLNQQTDQIFAGNPLKALRHRRKHQFTSGVETIQGEDFSKPKDIMKLIEEFEVAPDSDEEEEGEETKNSEPSIPSSQKLDDETLVKVDPEQMETKTFERSNSLQQRDMKSIPKLKMRSQERKGGANIFNNVNLKEISMQDIRNQLSNNNKSARVRIQIKTKRSSTNLLPSQRPSESLKTEN